MKVKQQNLHIASSLRLLFYESETASDPSKQLRFPNAVFGVYRWTFLFYWSTSTLILAAAPSNLGECCVATCQNKQCFAWTALILCRRGNVFSVFCVLWKLWVFKFHKLKINGFTYSNQILSGSSRYRKIIAVLCFSLYSRIPIRRQNTKNAKSAKPRKYRIGHPSNTKRGFLMIPTSAESQ